MKVKAIHISSGNVTFGYHIQTQKDLNNVNVHPLIEEGIKKYINSNIPIFINSNGGYCPVNGVYEIIT